MDVSINVNGLFPAHAESKGLAQSTSASAGVLASFRYLPARFATIQRLTNTTFPRSDLLLNGVELSQPIAPSKSGMAPSSPSKK